MSGTAEEEQDKVHDTQQQDQYDDDQKPIDVWVNLGMYYAQQRIDNLFTDCRFHLFLVHLLTQKIQKPVGKLCEHSVCGK